MSEKCPNGCGSLVTIKRPAWIPWDDVSELPEPLQNTVTACVLIRQICPECGYVVTDELNLKQCEEYLSKEKSDERCLLGTTEEAERN